MYTRIVLITTLAVAIQADNPQVAVKQDTLGNYNFRYAADDISSSKSQEVFGNVHDGFLYFDPHDIPHQTELTSGVRGFHAFGADIPKTAIDTPEVAHAKAQHLITLQAPYAEAGSWPPFFGTHVRQGDLLENYFVAAPAALAYPHPASIGHDVHFTKLYHSGLPVIGNAHSFEVPHTFPIPGEHFESIAIPFVHSAPYHATPIPAVPFSGGHHISTGLVGSPKIPVVPNTHFLKHPDAVFSAPLVPFTGGQYSSAGFSLPSVTPFVNNVSPVVPAPVIPEFVHFQRALPIPVHSAPVLPAPAYPVPDRTEPVQPAPSESALYKYVHSAPLPPLSAISAPGSSVPVVSAYVHPEPTLPISVHLGPVLPAPLHTGPVQIVPVHPAPVSLESILPEYFAPLPTALKHVPVLPAPLLPGYVHPEFEFSTPVHPAPVYPALEHTAPAYPAPAPLESVPPELLNLALVLPAPVIPTRVLPAPAFPSPVGPFTVAHHAAPVLPVATLPFTHGNQITNGFIDTPKDSLLSETSVLKDPAPVLPALIVPSTNGIYNTTGIIETSKSPALSAAPIKGHTVPVLELATPTVPAKTFPYP